MAEAFEVVWSPIAVRDLDEILEYLAEEAGIDLALRRYEEIRQRIATLATYPRRCRRVPELAEIGIEDFRELIVPPYRILFRLDGPRVNLLGVLDARRDLEEMLIQRALDL